jgi:DNA-dependent protein kinase catalytic subunit
MVRATMNAADQKFSMTQGGEMDSTADVEPLSVDLSRPDGLSDMHQISGQIKRRYLKESAPTDGEESRTSRSTYIAANERKKRKEEMHERTENIKRRRVVVLRKYRDGELPDIQIKAKDLLLPLYALADSDSVIASKLFGVLYGGLMRDSTPSGDEGKKKQIRSSCAVLLAQSQECTPQLISCLQSILLDDAELTCDPLSVFRTAKASRSLQKGILILEKQIASNFADTTNPGKKRRGPSPAQQPRQISHSVASLQDLDELHYLSRLYRELGDDDITRELYSNFSRVEWTRQALEKQLSHSYLEAIQLYDKAIDRRTRVLEGTAQWESEEPSDLELMLWDEERLQCALQLCEWPLISEQCLVDVNNDLSALFSEDNKSALQYFVESQLKLPSTGSSQLEELLRTATPEQLKALEVLMPLELAVSNIRMTKGGNTLGLINAGFGNLLRSFWAKFDAKSHEHLERLQRLVELEEVTGVLDSVTSHPERANESIMQVLNSWRDRLPSASLDSVLAWDDLISERENLTATFLWPFACADLLLEILSTHTLACWTVLICCVESASMRSRRPRISTTMFSGKSARICVIFKLPPQRRLETRETFEWRRSSSTLAGWA